MAILKPFRGIRPVKDKAHLVASKPYDVLNSEEARVEAQGNPYSFLHVVKSEIDLPAETYLYDAKVYAKAKENFEAMRKNDIFIQDTEDYLYIYAQKMDERTQYGIVGCSSVDDYFNNVIKKHELTRPDKEKDRMTHVDVTNINAGPVFITYPDVHEINTIVSGIIKNVPESDFTTPDGIQHMVWIIKDKKHMEQIVNLFEKIPHTYIADGHHRSASAAGVCKKRKESNRHHNGKEEYNFFLACHFPASQLKIIDYNRVVKDLNSLDLEQFLKQVSKNFIVNKKDAVYQPQKLHEFGMYLDNSWYSLEAKPGTYNEKDPIGILDVTILYNNILCPLLGINDLRTDKRIDFVGGIRGLKELERRVNSGEMRVAFAMFPVTIQQLMNIADTNNIMPPKTTWFEPKLRSGLIIHELD